MEELRKAKLDQLNQAYFNSQIVCSPPDYYARQERLMAVMAELLLLEHQRLTPEEDLLED